MKYIGLYCGRGGWVVPTTGTAQSGYYLEVDPVDIVMREDVSGLAAVLEARAAKGNPRVPNPDWSKPYVPAVVRATHAKNERDFEKGTRCFSLRIHADRVDIEELAPAKKGGFTGPPVDKETLSGSTDWIKISERLVRLVSS